MKQKNIVNPDIYLEKSSIQLFVTRRSAASWQCCDIAWMARLGELLFLETNYLGQMELTRFMKY